MKITPIPSWIGIPGKGTDVPALIRAVLPANDQPPQKALDSSTLHALDAILPVPPRRLIVLVPAGEIDEPALAHRVWDMATSSSLSVLYLALSPAPDQVSFQRRRLVGLAARTAYPYVRVETGVYTENSWSKALRPILQLDDLLACLAEDRTSGFFRRQPLAQWLTADLGVPVYQFDDLPVKPAQLFGGWLRNVLAWAASIALMAAFFGLQVGIERSLGRPQATILLCLSVLAELIVILKINEWIG